MYKSAFVVAVAVISSVAASQAVVALARSAEREPVRAAAAPPPPAAEGRDARLAKAADGHYWAEALVDGRHVRFLVDTGATVVALTLDDARRLGLTKDLVFDHAATTASGPVRAARVKLASVSVSGAKVADVDALVVEKGLQTSLLGMSYLGRLSRIEATPTAMVLRP